MLQPTINDSSHCDAYPRSLNLIVHQHHGRIELVSTMPFVNFSLPRTVSVARLTRASLSVLRLYLPQNTPLLLYDEVLFTSWVSQRGSLKILLLCVSCEMLDYWHFDHSSKSDVFFRRDHDDLGTRNPKDIVYLTSSAYKVLIFVICVVAHNGRLILRSHIGKSISRFENVFPSYVRRRLDKIISVLRSFHKMVVLWRFAHSSEILMTALSLSPSALILLS